MDNNDADIQIKVLDCLLNWKDEFLLPYEKHLKNLVNSKYLREELATWSLSEDSNLVEEEHRAQIVPLVIRLLLPKVRSLKTLASRKVVSLTFWLMSFCLIAVLVLVIQHINFVLSYSMQV